MRFSQGSCLCRCGPTRRGNRLQSQDRVISSSIKRSCTASDRHKTHWMRQGSGVVHLLSLARLCSPLQSLRRSSVMSSARCEAACQRSVPSCRHHSARSWTVRRADHAHVPSGNIIGNAIHPWFLSYFGRSCRSGQRQGECRFS